MFRMCVRGASSMSSRARTDSSAAPSQEGKFDAEGNYEVDMDTMKAVTDQRSGCLINTTTMFVFEQL